MTEATTLPGSDQTARLLQFHNCMALLRFLEERISELRAGGEAVGSVHLAIGQEAIAVGTCAALRPSDAVTAAYRGHGWAVAKGRAAGGGDREAARPSRRNQRGPRRICTAVVVAGQLRRGEQHRWCRCPDRARRGRGRPIRGLRAGGRGRVWRPAQGSI